MMTMMQRRLHMGLGGGAPLFKICPQRDASPHAVAAHNPTPHSFAAADGEVGP